MVFEPTKIIQGILFLLVGAKDERELLVGLGLGMLRLCNFIGTEQEIMESTACGAFTTRWGLRIEFKGDSMKVGNTVWPNLVIKT